LYRFPSESETGVTLVSVYETPDVFTVYAIPDERPIRILEIEIMFETNRDDPTGRMFAGIKF